jgi:Ca2+-transporting ATPase
LGPNRGSDRAALGVAAHSPLAADVYGTDPRLDVIPFESETKFMAPGTKQDGQSLIFSRCSRDMLQRCHLVEPEGKAVTHAIETYAGRACACSPSRRNQAPTRTDWSGRGFVTGSLRRFIGMRPPRDEAMDAIRGATPLASRQDDHRRPSHHAEAIERQLGLLSPT